MSNWSSGSASGRASWRRPCADATSSWRCWPTVCAIQWHRSSMAPVFTNLIDNASKFTRVGRVEVRLRAEPAQRGEPGRAVLTVRDTGVGIDAEVVPRLFQTFGQPDLRLA